MPSISEELIQQAQLQPLDRRSRDLRRRVVDAIAGERRGHLGPACSLIEIVRTLYDEYLHFRPDEPNWPLRDRAILSKGHGCLALYAILADKGFFPLADLPTFCAPESYLGGHPEAEKIPGVEASTGALGHGLSIGVGMALAARLGGGDHRVVVVTGDGELNEGSVWEAAMSAAKHQLDNLTLLVDYNKLQSYGPVHEVLGLEPLLDKWRAFGFGVAEVNGHSVDDLRRLYASLPLESGRPSAIICHTVKGKGIGYAESAPEWHHKARISDDELAALYQAIEEAP
ncbi:MAG: transketolase [Candidatus Sedimenticola sp. (ex Thyasira tokunagai)]